MFKKVIQFFKRLFHRKKKYTLEQIVPDYKHIDTEQLFEEVKPGDIIFALTPGSYERLKRLGLKHRIRPYIIAKKEKDYLIGYCGSSSKRDYKLSFDLTTNYYQVKKDGVINFDKKIKIPKKHIYSIIDHLTTIDILKINDQLSCNKKKELIVIEKEYVDGQVIRRNEELYWIYKYNENDSSQVYLLNKIEAPKKITIAYQQSLYTFDKSNDPIDLKIDSKCSPTSVITNLPNEVKEKKPKKEPKKKYISQEYYKDHHEYVYEFGQRFVLLTEVYIYLFTSKGRHYAIKEYDLEEEYPNLYCLDEIVVYKKDGLEDDEKFMFYLEDFIYTHPTYKWLLDEQTTVIPDETETKSEKNEKKSREYYKYHHEYEYEFGQRFLLYTDVYIYLFTSDGKNYALREYDVADSDEYPVLYCMKDIEVYQEDGLEDDDKLMFYLEDFIQVYPVYEWLLDEQTTVIDE